MTQIKSKKAMAFIDDNVSMGRLSFAVADIEYCAKLAENELAESHAQELQELRDKAVQAFCNHCLHKSVCADKKCATQQSFIYELNK